MKYLLVLALCLGAAVADHFQTSKDFHNLHYTQHEQTVNDAKKNLGATLGADVQTQNLGSFEEVGAYGGGVVDPTVGGSVNHELGFAGLTNTASVGGCLTNCLQKSLQESQQQLYAQLNQKPLLTYFPSSTGAHSENFVHREESVSRSQPMQTIHYTVPSGHSENYVRVEEQKVVQKPHVQVIIPAPSTGAHESYVKMTKVTTSSQPQVHVVPSGSLTMNSHINSDYRTGVNSGLVGGSAFEHMNAGLTSGSTTRQTSHQTQSTLGSGYTGNSAQLVSGLNFGATNAHLTNFGASNAHLSNFGSTGSSGTGLLKYMTEAEQLAKLQARGSSTTHSGYNAGYNTGYNSALTSSTGHTGGLTASNAYNSGLTSSTGYTGGLTASNAYNSGLTSATGYTGGLTASNAYNSGLTSSTGYTGGLHSSTGYNGGLASTSGFNSDLTSNSAYNSGVKGGFASTSGFDGGLASTSGFNSGLTAGNSGVSSGFGNVGGGFQTKSWEKSSKWSSQSGVDADGKVNNYNDLVTGQSENFNVNGKTGGYHAATATVDDNGKVSTYSLHS